MFGWVVFMWMVGFICQLCWRGLHGGATTTNNNNKNTPQPTQHNTTQNTQNMNLNELDLDEVSVDSDDEARAAASGVDLDDTAAAAAASPAAVASGGAVVSGVVVGGLAGEDGLRQRRDAKYDDLAPVHWRLLLLKKASARLRAFAGIAAWIVFLLFLYLASVHWSVPVFGLALLAVLLYGLSAATPGSLLPGRHADAALAGEEQRELVRDITSTKYYTRQKLPTVKLREGELDTFRFALMFWMCAAALYLLIGISMGAVGDHARSRCSASNAPFVGTFGTNCEQRFAKCQEDCRYRVKVMLLVEIAALAISVAFVLQKIISQARDTAVALVEFEYARADAEASRKRQRKQ